MPPILGAALAHVHMPDHGYGSGKSTPILRRLKSFGANTIQLNPFGYQASLAERRIQFDDPTLTRDALVREIQAIHAAGLKVMLAPHIWVNQSATMPWRSQVYYSDEREANQWFESYTKFILHFANIAKETGVAIFSVGVELEAMAKYEGHFRSLIREIRLLGFKGLITYECEAWNAENIRFWDDLDFIGINMYYSYPHEPRGTDDLRFPGLVNFQKKKLAMHAAHASRVGKPLVITEFGYPSHALAISQTSAAPDSIRQRDDMAQKTGFEAFSAAIADLPADTRAVFRGIIVWKYVTTLDSYERRAWEKDFILQEKPAEALIAPLFRKVPGS